MHKYLFHVSHYKRINHGPHTQSTDSVKKSTSRNLQAVIKENRIPLQDILEITDRNITLTKEDPYMWKLYITLPHKENDIKDDTIEYSIKSI
jgi:hypothetical protein